MWLGGSSRSCAQTPKPPDWCFSTSLTFRYKEKEVEKGLWRKINWSVYALTIRTKTTQDEDDSSFGIESIHGQWTRPQHRILQSRRVLTELSSHNDDNIPGTWNVATATPHTALFLDRHDETSNNSIDRYPKQSSRNCVVCKQLWNFGVFFSYVCRRGVGRGALTDG